MNRKIHCDMAIGFAFLLMSWTMVVGQDTGKATGFDEVVNQLRDADFKVRLKGLNKIGALRPKTKELAPHVIHLFKDPHFEVRSSAANVFGNMQNALPDIGTQFPDSVPQLIRLLSDRDPDDKYQKVRRFAAYALNHLGALSKAAVPDLLKIAVDTNEDALLRVEALQALGNIGHASPEVMAGLTKLLDDPARTNASYPSVGSAANFALGRFKDQPAAANVFLDRLKVEDDTKRAAAARALGTTAFGSLEAEKALIELLDDKSEAVQKAALSSLEGINETYTFFFRNNVTSSAVTAKQQALLQEIKNDADRKARFKKISAAQFRLAKVNPLQVRALKRLVELEAREYVPLLKEHFATMEKKVQFLEWADLRLQLLIALAAWLPDKEAVPFLIGVDTDADEARQSRFRAAVLLCERGDAPSVAHIVKRHSEEAKKVEPLINADGLQKLLQDRRLFDSDKDFESLKAVPPDELAAIQKGIQLAQYLYGIRSPGDFKTFNLTKVHLNQGNIESLQFRLMARSEGWGFELRKKAGLWLPCKFQMTGIA